MLQINHVPNLIFVCDRTWHIIDKRTKYQSMSGRGKGKKGLGKGGAQRHRRPFRDEIQHITKSDIRRLARRGGVKRLSGLCYGEAKDALKLFHYNVIEHTVTYCEYSRRKTITAMDVVHGLKRHGKPLYGAALKPQ